MAAGLLAIPLATGGAGGGSVGAIDGTGSSAPGGTGAVATSIAQPATHASSSAADTYVPGHLEIRVTRWVGGFSLPLYVTYANSSANRWYVVEQGGRIRVIVNGARLSTPFLDLHNKISCCGERGLLGLAFHPSYATNGKFYVDYTDRNGNTVVSEFHRSSSSPNRASTTERVLLRIAQPYANHNGGMLAFGPDGFLYIGMGDGGSAGDPGNRAQNTNIRLGKILRIDVDGRDSGLPYAIPDTNPFVGTSGDDLVWAFGLRNPWRFSFDRATGDLWIGDVGQSRYEEIDRALAADGGGRGVNFGWRVMEGDACYSPASGCDTSGKQRPLTTYTHSLGCAVTGGYVYRGTKYPALVGAYVFGDYCSGRIWAVQASGAATQVRSALKNTTLTISSFGEGPSGQLYVVDYAGGAVYRLSGFSQ